MDGYSLHVVTLQDCERDPYSPSTATPNTRLVKVDVVLADVSNNRSLDVNKDRLLLIDTRGVAHTPLAFGCDTVHPLVPLKVPRGYRTRGTISFELPKDAGPASIVYNLGESGKDLRVSLDAVTN
jgi:hypothetical protein